MTIRVRYAPSPTGHLHIGGARTALFDYLLARSQRGQFVIRFEDTDQSRHEESGIQDQLDGLKWLGIDWDESVDIGGPYAPYRQTERLHLYQPYTDRLLLQGDVYPCYCSAEELEAEREQQKERGETPQYSGKCRHLTEAEIRRYKEEGRKPSLRFRVPDQQKLVIHDSIRGAVEFDTDGIGDFIVMRPDGLPTYNYAVVLDDHMMAITHVIRGEEHLTNTPRQMLIYQALNMPLPQFAHLALILNPDRKKMSKRDESLIQFIEQYRTLGYLPEAVLNFIVLLGWSPGGEEEIFDKEQLIDLFRIDHVSKSPAVFDLDKLNWMNNHYIKKADLERVVELAVPHLRQAGYIPEKMDDALRQWVSVLVGLYQEQLSYVAEIVDLARMFFVAEVEYSEEARELLNEHHVPAVLDSFYRQLDGAAVEEHSPEQMQALLKQVQKETGYKGKQLFMTVRVALTGQIHGRDLNQTLFLLGRAKLIARLRGLLS